MNFSNPSVVYVATTGVVMVLVVIGILIYWRCGHKKGQIVTAFEVELMEFEDLKHIGMIVADIDEHDREIIRRTYDHLHHWGSMALIRFRHADAKTRQNLRDQLHGRVKEYEEMITDATERKAKRLREQDKSKEIGTSRV